ncbi:RimK family alpha-L-glutamate ligase [Gilvimarinus sp. F26214L]|uniref:RimK family alpha-L-glutamate ligase n=1 Tax=Gilvimarinus sp. DZF01 TaxID=3461371 RepID=UPI0040463D8C
MTTAEERIIVGSEEWCVFPSLNIPAIKARVDSGAKTSAIHAFNIQGFRKNDEDWVSFQVHPLQNDRKSVVQCEAPVVDRRVVKSSTGTAEKRYVIRTDIELGDNYWEVELTLTNRDSMGYRMLLGREAMLGRMLVDPAESFCGGQFSEDELKAFYGENEHQSGLKIGLLATDPGLYSNRRILEAGTARGHEMVFLNIQQCYVKLDMDNPEVHYLGGHTLTDFDAVIPRIRADVTFYGCALTRHFASLGIFALNTADAISHSRDKLLSLQALQSADIPIPTTAFANSPVDIDDLIAMIGGPPLLVKQLDGGHHKSIKLAETREQARAFINDAESRHANMLVQHYVSEAEGKSLRCFVVDGKVVASMEMTTDFNDRKKMRRSGRAVRSSDTEKQLAVRAAKALRLKVAGVDMLRSANGPLVIGVTAVPSLEEMERVTNKDIAGKMARAVEKALGWRLAAGKQRRG